MAMSAHKSAVGIVLVIVLFGRTGFCSGAGGMFFREYWGQYDEKISNTKEKRWRVNDEAVSLHERFGKRSEPAANGLALIDVPEDLFGLDGAELYLEMWGGHPRTANKRLYVNGRGPYVTGDDGAEEGNCAYSYPTIDLAPGHLVRGTNALQFACDRGQSFWGHFIIDNMCIRCYLKADHPDLVAAGVQDFTAEVQVGESGRVLKDSTVLSLYCPKEFEQSVVSVDYFGRYFGYDDNGNRLENDWHGYTQNRQYKNHIGRATAAPFRVKWDTTMIPDQDKPMAVKAVVSLKEGFQYVTPVLEGLSFPADRNKVRMYKCARMPVPFWSRANNVKTADMDLPGDISGVEQARLMVKIWDGGEGTVKDHFKINGRSYPITSGRHIHDVVFTDVQVDISDLKDGENTITLLSDTEHHGIEVLLPGPCFVLRYGKSAAVTGLNIQD